MMNKMCFFLLAALALSAHGGNLVANGDFEDILRDRHPNGYSRAPEWGGTLAETSFFTSTTNAYSGKYAGLYSCQNRGGFISYRNIHVKPSTWYRFSARIATDVDPVMESTENYYPPPGAYIRLMLQVPGDGFLNSPQFDEPILYAGGGRQDWKLCEKHFKSDAVYTNMWFGIYIMKVNGTARFDEIRIEEVTEAEAREGLKREKGVAGADGENLLVNGSFEIACNDDMPDFIFSGIGAPWFDDRWEMKRIGSPDSPHGTHFFRVPYYMSEIVKTDPERDVTVSFMARSDRPGQRIKAGFGPGAWPEFTLSEKWQRFVLHPKRSAGGRLNIASVRKGDAAFDLDAVMVSYGTNAVPYKAREEETFFPSFARYRQEQGAKRNREFADKSFAGPLAVPAPAADDKIDFRFDTVFVGEGLTVRGRIGGAARTLSVTNAAGATVWSGTVSSADLAKGVSVAKDLPEGTYSLVGVPWTFRVVKSAAKWCRVDRFAHMAFTEKGPYLPTGFSMAHTELFASRIPEIAEAGFNTALVWGFGSNTVSRFREFEPTVTRSLLDRFAAAGLDVVAFTPEMPAERHHRLLNDKSVPKVFGWAIRQNTFETINRAKLDFVRELKDHPAIRMWHYYDEIYGPWPLGPCSKKESDIAVTYREARAIDPYRLHWNNSTYANKLYGGPESTDITSATIYTIRYTGGVQATVGAGEGLVKVGGTLGGKPGMAGIWVQFYGGNGEVGSYGREPSAEEMEAMLYGCAIKGVRAFWFFSMRPRSNRLWFHTGDVARELDSLKDVFAYGTQQPFAGTHPDVGGIAYEQAGKLYLITCNGAYWDATSKLNLPSAYRKGTAKVLFEDRTVAFDEWTLKDDWKALSRHVYVIEGM